METIESRFDPGDFTLTGFYIGDALQPLPFPRQYVRWPEIYSPKQIALPDRWPDAWKTMYRDYYGYEFDTIPGAQIQLPQEVVKRPPQERSRRFWGRLFSAISTKYDAAWTANLPLNTPENGIPMVLFFSRRNDFAQVVASFSATIIPATPALAKYDSQPDPPTMFPPRPVMLDRVVSIPRNRTVGRNAISRLSDHLAIRPFELFTPSGSSFWQFLLESEPLCLDLSHDSVLHAPSLTLWGYAFIPITQQNVDVAAQDTQVAADALGYIEEVAARGNPGYDRATHVTWVLRDNAIIQISIYQGQAPSLTTVFVRELTGYDYVQVVLFFNLPTKERDRPHAAFVAHLTVLDYQGDDWWKIEKSAQAVASQTLGNVIGLHNNRYFAESAATNAMIVLNDGRDDSIAKTIVQVSANDPDYARLWQRLKTIDDPQPYVRIISADPQRRRRRRDFATAKNVAEVEKEEERDAWDGL